MATQLMSKKPTSYLDVMKQNKPNLFDFSDVKPTQTKQMNFGQPVSQRNVTNFTDYQSTLPKQQPTTTKSSGFSIIPTTNAGFNEGKYLSKQKVKEIIDGRPEGVQPMEIFSQLEQKGYIMEGYNDTQKPQDINQMGLLEEGGQRLSNLGTKLGERAGKFGEAFTKERSENPFVAGLQNIGAGIGAVGQIAGGIGDIAFEGLAYVTPDIVKETLTGGAKKAWENTPETIKQTAINAIKVGGEEYKQFKQNNPFLADTLEGSLNIASLAPIGYGGKVAGKGIEKTGEVLTKGGKKVISKLTPDLQQKAYDISTKANRFVGEDIRKFYEITGESPGEFAVKRGMTKTGDEAVDEATKNWITSMKQADSALEQIGGNFKIQQGPDFIDGAFKGLQKKLSKYSPEIDRVNQLANKYRTEGLTMPEINEVKRLYASNHKYNWLDVGSKQATTSRDIQDGLRKWQFAKAKEMGLQNLDEINKNTQGWRAFADDLAKKLKRSEGNNNISLTDWVSLSGGNPTNIALFLGKKVGESKKFKELLIRKFGKQTKEAIITPDINKPQIKGLLPRGPVITPAPEFKSGIKVTPSTIQPNVKTQKALPPGKVVTPQTSEKGVIQESKIPLKNTKYGTNSNIPSNMNNTRTDKLLKPNQTTNVSNKSIKKPSETGRKVLKKILPSNFKEKAQDFVEGVADKVGAKTKLLPTNSKQVSINNLKTNSELQKIKGKYKTGKELIEDAEIGNSGKKWLNYDYELKTKNIDDLIPTYQLQDYEKQIAKGYAKDIKSGDVFPPIQIDNKGNIINGNHRYEAYKQLGIKDIPVLEAVKEGNGKLLNENILTNSKQVSKMGNEGIGADKTKLLKPSDKVDFKKVEEYFKQKSGLDDVTEIMDRFKKSSIENQQNVMKKINTPKVLIENKSSKPSYGIQHRPTEGTPVNEIDKLIGEDIYNNPNYFYNGGDKKAFNESIQAIKQLKGQPEKEITIYRAGSKNELNKGDWVTLSKTYAKDHGERNNLKVYEFKVKAKDIHFAGDDVNEFGYFPQKTKLLKPSDKGLIEEAKKYKSAEEFINKKISDEAFKIREDLYKGKGLNLKTVYHGTSEGNYKKILDSGSLGLEDDSITYFTSSKKEAQEYAKNKANYRGEKGKGVVIEVEIPAGELKTREMGVFAKEIEGKGKLKFNKNDIFEDKGNIYLGKARLDDEGIVNTYGKLDKAQLKQIYEQSKKTK